MNPQHPIYIVSKGRWESRLTSKALEIMRVPYYIVVEEQEFEQYKREIKNGTVLILDKKYQREYKTYDSEGDKKGKSLGPGPARNFAWAHAIENGHAWHWVMDDNIDGFLRFNKNRKVFVTSGTIFRCMEDYCNRYTNVLMAGPHYVFFVKRKYAVRRGKFMVPPVTLNTRIYSCNLIRNDIPYRWRGRYNEDTDLSLQILKDGNCTILFNAFLQNKAMTQVYAGGNTKEFYEHEGTFPKSELLAKMHPDVARVVWKFGRWHHTISYKKHFSKNKLVSREGVNVAAAVDNYGMILQE